MHFPRLSKNAPASVPTPGASTSKQRSSSEPPAPSGMSRLPQGAQEQARASNHGLHQDLSKAHYAYQTTPTVQNRIAFEESKERQHSFAENGHLGSTPGFTSPTHFLDGYMARSRVVEETRTEADKAKGEMDQTARKKDARFAAKDLKQYSQHYKREIREEMEKRNQSVPQTNQGMTETFSAHVPTESILPQALERTRTNGPAMFSGNEDSAPREIERWMPSHSQDLPPDQRSGRPLDQTGSIAKRLPIPGEVLTPGRPLPVPTNRPNPRTLAGIDRRTIPTKPSVPPFTSNLSVTAPAEEKFLSSLPSTSKQGLSGPEAGSSRRITFAAGTILENHSAPNQALQDKRRAQRNKDVNPNLPELPASSRATNPEYAARQLKKAEGRLANARLIPARSGAEEHTTPSGKDQILKNAESNLTKWQNQTERNNRRSWKTVWRFFTS